MKKSIKFFVCSTLYLICATAGYSTTINVPADQATIQDGIDASSNGDTVLVAPGVFYEHLNFNGKSIVLISSDGPDSTTLSPIFIEESHIVISSGEDSTTKLSGFTITGCKVNTVVVYGTSPTIEYNIFHDNVYLGGAYEGHVEVITLNNSSALIYKNLFYSNGGDGCVWLSTGCEQARVINNTFNNNKLGIYASGGGIVVNNIITNCSQTGIYGFGCNYTVLDYNNVWGNRTNFSSGCTPGVNNISEDPLYAYEFLVFKDYLLEPQSPCLNSGDPDPLYNNPDGSRANMGAFGYFECCNLVGDFSHSNGLSISDLNLFVYYMFKGGNAPECSIEADLDGSSVIDISDITYFVNFMFKSGPAPVSCN